MSASMSLFGMYPRIKRLLKSLRRRSPEERRALLSAGVAVLGIGVLLRVMPYARLQKMLAWRMRPPHRATANRDALDEQERRIVWAVSAVARRFFPRRPCLPQALAAQYLIRRAGLPVPDLRIGVRRSPDTGHLAAHAWLERSGRILLGGPLSSAIYEPLTPRQSDQ